MLSSSFLISDSDQYKQWSILSGRLLKYSGKISSQNFARKIAKISHVSKQFSTALSEIDTKMSKFNPGTAGQIDNRWLQFWTEWSKIVK